MNRGDGPAFPTGTADNGVIDFGITIRELFAALSMAGLRAAEIPEQDGSSLVFARDAIADANALLAELGKTSGTKQ